MNQEPKTMTDDRTVPRQGLLIETIEYEHWLLIPKDVPKVQCECATYMCK